MVFIDVGPQNARFPVPKALLTKHSTVFTDILSPDYEPKDKEVSVGKDKDSVVISLEHEVPEIFVRVQHWLRSGRFLFTEEGEEWTDVTWELLISVYLFSVQFRIEHLYNACIEATILIIVVTEGRRYPKQDAIDTLFDYGDEASPLCALIVKIVAKECDLREILRPDRPDHRSYHHKFLNCLVVEMYRILNSTSSPRDPTWWARKGLFYWREPTAPYVVDWEVLRILIAAGYQEAKAK